MLLSYVISVFFLSAVYAERDWKYFGYEQHVLGEGRVTSTTVHNPFLDNGVVGRNAEDIPEGNIGHHVERREIFGKDDRSEVDRESIPEESRIPELATVRQ